MAAAPLDLLWEELHRRFCEGAPPTTVTLRDLSLDQRRALADLLASDRLPRSTARVRVDRLTRALGCGDVDELRAAVIRRCGPIVDRRAMRQAARAARAGLWEWLTQQVADIPLARDQDVLRPWVETLRAAGVPGSGVAAHRRRLEAVVAVLHSLPRDGAALAGVADDILGDPHGLDHGRATARIVLEAVAMLTARERPADAEETRLLWEDVGVVPDPLSSTVLALGLRPTGEEPLAAWVRAAAEASEPVVLTLAQLRRWPLPPLASRDVAYVVENPSLLMEAAAEPWRGPPVLCSSG
ncbi:MAG: TIGR02679 domain-containing protein, partial [Dehalococcoidia bacterium]